MKKTAIAIFATLPLSTGALAQADVEGPDCDGIVTRFGRYLTLEPRDGEICSPKWVTDFNSEYARQILRICPIGSHCHVEGVYSNHGIASVTRVKRQ
jgi:hypothetical protein